MMLDYTEMDRARPPDMKMAAQWYAAHDIPVFPLYWPTKDGGCSCGSKNCHSRGKHPLTPHGFKDASTDLAQVTEWWNRWPRANIGVPTGIASGLLVVDVDTRNGGTDSLEALILQYGRFPETAEQMTGGGGRHILFRYSGGPVPKTLAPGIDLKASGGYFVAAPSLHPSGSCYQWDGIAGVKALLNPSEAPVWLLEAIRLARNGARAKPTEADGKKWGEGQRNDRLASLAGTMRRRGMTREAIEAALLSENRERCDPPLSEGEVRRIAESVARYKPADEAQNWSGPRAAFTPPGASEDQSPDFAEDTLARAFTARHGTKLRYVAPWGDWLKWDGARWAKDRTLHIFDLARDICREASTQFLEKPSTAARLASAATVAAVERLARADRKHAATVEQWDNNPWLLNTPNGTLELATGKLRKHQREDYWTKMTAVGPGGNCPLWCEFLQRVTDADKDLQAFLQRMVGYGLTGVTREHALFLLYGTGANGKGVFLSTISGIFGDYAKAAAIEAFVVTVGERHPTDLAGLQGARLVTAVETEDGRRWAESKIKAITGGEPIAARFMRQDFFEFTPQFKLVIAGNHKPGLRTVDEAMRRRLHLVPFTVTIPKLERDETLVEKLRDEWPGILDWAIDGCLDWQQRGLDPPQAVREATEEYMAAEDALGRWIEECCERIPDSLCTTARLFTSWKVWAEACGEFVGSQKKFAEKLADKGFEKGRQGGTGKKGFRGIIVRSEL